MKVKDIMTKDPLTIDPEAPLGTATDVMRTKDLRHLPVVDEAGRLIGIITDRDLRHAAFAPAVDGIPVRGSSAEREAVGENARRPSGEGCHDLGRGDH